MAQLFHYVFETAVYPKNLTQTPHNFFYHAYKKNYLSQT